MKKNNPERIIYKVTHKETGTVYIGATTRNLEDRKKDHLKKVSAKSKKPLHKAIASYGAEAFTWESIDTAITNNELAEKEVNYIFKFSEDTELYNQSRGGEIQKELYKYDAKTLKLVAQYSSLSQAAISIGYTKQALSKVCLSVNQKLDNYYWSYKCSEYHKPIADKRKKQVFQYSVDGIYVNNYKSIADANRQTKVNKTSIAKACRGERKTAGGYLWKY
ncbi:GIY-YIG nuclease family protein [Algibacter sp. 2305UL17-15]|uniref:GIY-YIG nuclease family protein n=1 Tax=Algibacter sp. 2305UL17-15 TaxID=3231268 RepID=UPI003459E541